MSSLRQVRRTLARMLPRSTAKLAHMRDNFELIRSAWKDEMLIRITATTRYQGNGPHRSARWTGDPGWLSLPQPGNVWAHCDEWTGEEFGQVWWSGPGSDPGPVHDLEVPVDVEVLDHLIADHGFVE